MKFISYGVVVGYGCRRLYLINVDKNETNIPRMVGRLYVNTLSLKLMEKRLTLCQLEKEEGWGGSKATVSSLGPEVSVFLNKIKTDSRRLF